LFPDTVVLLPKQKALLAQLCECIPDLDPRNPETMQRIFCLGLYALSRQVICQTEENDASLRDLMALVKGMIDE